ncbi:putative bifunctional diguanylate cyclase/phosphodiesterase [Microbaculum marinum]|uniref:EAL domain-containing protein n=1 Tax=Microbaculum marinum TaxID=1764581 RepID=A0AAW9RK63_9HYPH
MAREAENPTPGPIARSLRLIRQMGWSDIGFLCTAVALLFVGLVRQLLGYPPNRPLALLMFFGLFVFAVWYVITAVRRRQRLAFFSEAINKAPSAFALYDDLDRLIAWNDMYETVHPGAFRQLSPPFTYEQLVRTSLAKTLSGRELDEELERRLRSHREATGVPVDRQGSDGRWLRVLKARTESGANVGVGIDVTELYEATAQADREHARFRGVAETLPVGIWHYDADGRTLFVNHKLLALFGLSDAGELDGVCAPDYLSRNVEGYQSGDWSANRYELGNLTIRGKDGSSCHVILYTSKLPKGVAGGSETIMSFVDVTALKDAERRIEYLALRDMLTGARNRAAFMDAVARAADTATHSRPCWLLAMDLDGFKPVNDRYGHAAGDILLRVLTDRIQKARPANSRLYRVGGDEFSLVVEGASRTEAEEIANAILTVTREPFRLDHGQVFVNMTIGIAAMPFDTSVPETVQRYADLALYAGKQVGGGTYVFFAPELAERNLEEHILTLDLGRALADNEFSMVYQPVFDRETRTVVAAEALLRWTNRRTGQSVPTADFVRTAEHVRLITGIDFWVLNHNARLVSAWQARGVAVPLVMVNMSPPTLEDPDFLPRLDEILRQYPAIRGRLCMELTEGVAVKDRRKLSQTFRELESRGIRTAIDDFGTGQTSVTLLRDLPVDFIKIDRSYIEGIEDDTQAMAIVSTILNLGRKLDVRVIAEGVETNAQLDALEEAGCELIQGYLWGRPTSAAEIEAMVGGQTTADAEAGDPDAVQEPMAAVIRRASDRLP